MRLKGGPQLRARLRAIKKSFKPIGKKWAETTRDLAKASAPVRTGRLRQSIRVKNASQKRATVAAHYSASFVIKGTKAHTIRPKRARSLVFEVGGRTIFSRKVDHPRTRPNDFATPAARESLRKHPMAQTLIDEWNRAA